MVPLIGATYYTLISSNSHHDWLKSVGDSSCLQASAVSWLPQAFTATGLHLTLHLFLAETQWYITLIFSVWHIACLSHSFLNLPPMFACFPLPTVPLSFFFIESANSFTTSCSILSSRRHDLLLFSFSLISSPFSSNYFRAFFNLFWDLVLDFNQRNAFIE